MIMCFCYFFWVISCGNKKIEWAKINTNSTLNESSAVEKTETCFTYIFMHTKKWKKNICDLMFDVSICGMCFDEKSLCLFVITNNQAQKMQWGGFLKHRNSQLLSLTNKVFLGRKSRHRCKCVVCSANEFSVDVNGKHWESVVCWVFYKTGTGSCVALYASYGLKERLLIGFPNALHCW